jgi:hypothetical protein
VRSSSAQDMQQHAATILLMRCRAAGLREALPRGSCRQTASIFKRFIGHRISYAHKGMVDERIISEEMYTRICEENGPADPVPKALSRRWREAADSGGI